MNPLGGIEAGGTKFVCGVGTGPEDLAVEQFPTTSPGETVERVTRFFREKAGAQLQAIGIGSFGPVDLHEDSPTYGHITTTPKTEWRNYNLRGAVAAALGAPVAFDTDVNAAAVGEGRWGAAQGLSDFVYLTVGTGIGGGAVVNGRLIHGLVHTEMGHLRIPHDTAHDPFPGVCPYHGDCLEGLASGPAMQARWGVPGSDLPPEHPAWELEARYLGLALANFAVTLSPQRIIVGGGVMSQPHLFDMVREEVARLLNGYVAHPEVTDHLDRYIVPPQLGGRAGVLGALALAQGVLA